MNWALLGVALAGVVVALEPVGEATPDGGFEGLVAGGAGALLAGTEGAVAGLLAGGAGTLLAGADGAEAGLLAGGAGALLAGGAAGLLGVPVTVM